ncbi:cytochrome P450 [Lojkania enalia]|uniref:Cytochrome P450 n=1 Tax=Lojkania enalia TaxID=147567 RepID=A0A9P4K1P8_9PLEO|nr:cytochrome P450 [Didymosphaeria enalia]
MPKPPPQLPQGTSSTLRGFSETFSFHASPESFITSRTLDYQREHPELVESRAVIRAKVLNRNVAVISTYAQIKQVLEQDGVGYEAKGAYDELMAPFFPSPNLLLADGTGHGIMRRIWESRVAPFHSNIAAMVESCAKAHFDAIPTDTNVDLYECMKTLSWKIVLGSFLDLRNSDTLFSRIEGLQEELLRGQFSLFPVSINTGFWHSPRKRGINAKEKLQSLIAEHLKSREATCPFSTPDKESLEDVVNHTVLVTSSLAVKAIASLLAALCLNLYVYRDKDGLTLADEAGRENNVESFSTRIRAILMETERLSPPIVGIMRRSTRDNIISSPGEHADIQVPKGWDSWLYFVGAGRDPMVFGSTWDRFDPGRYNHSRVPEAMAFSTGAKTCLGRDVVRKIAFNVAKSWLNLGLRFEGKVNARGVRGWLGWEPNDSVKPEEWAADMKQLPTQRPSAPVMVRITRDKE